MVAQATPHDPIEPRITDLCIALLNGYFQIRTVTRLNWIKHFQAFLVQVRQPALADSVQNCPFGLLPVAEKVRCIYMLCEARLDTTDMQSGQLAHKTVKEIHPESMRVVPFGQDNDGRIYWYFSGSRLYRETLPPPEDMKCKFCNSTGFQLDNVESHEMNCPDNPVNKSAKKSRSRSKSPQKGGRSGKKAKMASPQNPKFAFECEFDCGFDGPTLKIVEAHEKVCTKNSNAVLTSSESEENEDPNPFECEFECGFDGPTAGVVEAHEARCPQNPKIKNAAKSKGKGNGMQTSQPVPPSSSSSRSRGRSRGHAPAPAAAAAAATPSSPSPARGGRRSSRRSSAAEEPDTTGAGAAADVEDRDEMILREVVAPSPVCAGKSTSTSTSTSSGGGGGAPMAERPSTAGAAPKLSLAGIPYWDARAAADAAAPPKRALAGIPYWAARGTAAAAAAAAASSPNPSLSGIPYWDARGISQAAPSDATSGAGEAAGGEKVGAVTVGVAAAASGAAVVVGNGDFECEFGCGYDGSKRDVEDHERICDKNPLNQLLDGGCGFPGALPGAVWEVVCNGVADWSRLMGELKCKDKRSPQFELYSLLAEDFVPKFEAEFQADERKRLKLEKYASMPRRISSRAAAVMEKKEEEDRLLAIADAARAEAEAERWRLAKIREEEKKLRARAERSAAREAKLSALREERQERRSAAGDDVDTAWYRSAKNVHRSCQEHADSFLFREPVNEDDAPSYYDVVTHPTDLKTIGANLDKQLYVKKEDFAVEMYEPLQLCLASPPSLHFVVFFVCVCVCVWELEETLLVVLRPSIRDESY